MVFKKKKTYYVYIINKYYIVYFVQFHSHICTYYTCIPNTYYINIKYVAQVAINNNNNNYYIAVACTLFCL